MLQVSIDEQNIHAYQVSSPDSLGGSFPEAHTHVLLHFR